MARLIHSSRFPHRSCFLPSRNEDSPLLEQRAVVRARGPGTEHAPCRLHVADLEHARLHPAGSGQELEAGAPILVNLAHDAGPATPVRE